ncbi:MAG: hypothetical protein GXY83_00830 [Rhodopirellula sp.]|nr:hypothetical protein [Rhodopirellula sp.]
MTDAPQHSPPSNANPWAAWVSTCRIAAGRLRRPRHDARPPDDHDVTSASERDTSERRAKRYGVFSPYCQGAKSRIRLWTDVT